MSFISLDNISFSYSDIESGQPYKNAVDGVSLNIEKGEFVALLGHNGCGKSTVAKHLNAMLLPDKGKVYVDGDDTSDENKTYDIREKVGLVLQNPDNQLVASVVEEDVAFGPENLGIPPKEITSHSSCTAMTYTTARQSTSPRSCRTNCRKSSSSSERER